METEIAEIMTAIVGKLTVMIEKTEKMTRVNEIITEILT